MTKLKKFLTIFLIFFVTFLVLFTNKASAGNIGNSFKIINGYINGDKNRYWRNELFCIEHGANFTDTDTTYDLTLTDTVTYRSDSTDAFERGIAYIIYTAANTEMEYENSKHKMNCYGWNKNAGKYNGNEYQQALWKFLKNSKHPAKAPFTGCKTAEVTENVLAETAGIFNTAENIGITNFSNKAYITINNFVIDGSTGHFTVQQLSDKAIINNITITYDNAENYTGKLYTNKEKTTTINKENIKEGMTVYMDINNNKKVRNIAVSAKTPASGYSVTIYRYGNGDAQDLIYTEAKNGDETTATGTATPKYVGYQLEIQKVDYDNPNILLNNCEFAIYLDANDNKNDGWLGYNETKHVVEMRKSYSQSYKFITGKKFEDNDKKSYCNLAMKNGGIKLDNILPGTYYIFETKTKEGDARYSLDSQFGYKDEKNIPQGTGITGEYAYCGFLEVVKKGSEYEKFIIPNRKTTELKITKIDEKKGTPIEGVGIKILVDKAEYSKQMGNDLNVKFVWLKQDGTFTTDYKEAYEFKTNAKGKISIKRVPYGKYYIYEVTPAENYSLSRQNGYNDGKPDEYKGEFPKEWVYLGTQTIKQKIEKGIINYEPKKGKGIIEEGVYTIAAFTNNGFVLDVESGASISGANVQIYQKNGTNAQRYRFIHVGNDYYRIQNVNSGKYLDLAGAICKEGSNIQQYESNNSDAQLWKVTRADNSNGYVIKSKRNEKFCIGIDGSKIENNVNVELQNYVKGKSNQTFSLKLLYKEETYTIASSMDEMFVLDIAGGSKLSGANTRIYYNNGTNAQKYRLIYVGDGYYMIENVNSGKYLDLSGGMIREYQNIYQYEANYTDAQLWKITQEKDPSGYIMYVIKPKGSDNYCIGVNGNIAINGANIELQKYLTNKGKDNKENVYSQRFVFYENDITQYSIAPSAPVSEKDTKTVVNGCYLSLGASPMAKSSIGTKTNVGETENFQIVRAIYQHWTEPTYFIYNRKGELVFDVQGSSVKPVKNKEGFWCGTVQTYTNNRTGAQKWKLQDGSSNGHIDNISSISDLDTGHTLKFISSADEEHKTVLNLIGNKIENKIQVYTDDGTDACKFVVKKTNNGSLVSPVEIESTEQEIAHRTITFEAVNKEGGKITIIKQDKDEVSKKLQGAEFKIYKENGGWLIQNDEETSYNTDYSKATAFVTDKSGQRVIDNLDFGNYYIYETKAPTNYSLSAQEGYLKAEKGSDSITDKEWVYAGTCKIEKTKGEVEVPLVNERLGSLSITKQDSDTKEKLVGTEFKLYATNLNTNIIAGGKGWVTLNNGQIGYSTDYNNANAFTTNNEGTVLVENLSYGTYYIYETKAPTGYNIKEQDSYHVQQEGSTTIPQDQDWVAFDNRQISSQNKDAKVTLNNHKYTKIKGRVWQDNPDGKANAYNNIYDGKAWTSQDQNITNDSLISGITVNLYSNKNGNDELISTTTTGENGEYEFEKKTEGEHKGDKLTYLELENSYVEFLYDNTQYVLTTPFVGDDMTVNSKAQAKEIITTGGEHNMGELYDGNLGLNEGKFPGKAVTYQENDGQTQQKITEYYNNDTYTIENINLGLIKKLPNEFAVNQELEYVKIVRENYTFTYKYGENAVIDEDTQKTQSTIAFQNSKRTFTHAVYPSDIKYNIANGLDENDANSYKIYVVYKIGVKNTTPHDNPDLYQEDKFYLTSLVNTYDTTRLQLSTDEIGNDVENAQFKLWSNNDGQATYDLANTNNVYKDGLAKNETKESYIQFKVTQNALTDLITKNTEENFVETPTSVNAKGYHIYKRNDKNWKDKELYTHRTIDSEANDGALFIKWKLADTRKISGVVFEDTKVNQLKDEEENSRENERIGNGKLDIDENNGTYKENTVSDVIVSLMDAETKKVAKVYNGDLVRGADGIWTATSRDAIVKVKDDGSYEIPDVVPGRYYLKFTYGNGETEYTDLNGNKIKIESKIKGQEDPIKSYLYKSTIITGAAYDANSENEKTWFLKSIDEGVYSIAVDDENEINNRIGIAQDNLKTELNYDYTTKQSSSTINANSPIMNIQFEYISEKEIDANLLRNDPNNQNPLRTNCTGMSFGIIERPHVNIELEKKIKNVKLTLQNGTTIINGDPKDKNVSPNLASIDDSNAKLELDSSYIYGSNAVVTYTLSAENKSELDYATPEYYKYGENKDNLVTTTVTKIADYINNQNASYENQSENVKVLNDTEKNNYFSAEVSNKNKNYKQTVFITDKALLPEAATPDDLSKSRTDEYEFTVNNLLSTSDGALGWESYAEIIGITNITLTPQSVSKSGNYVVGDNSTKEADTAEATISIYSSTGENRNLVIYYVTGGALLIIAVGIVLIKKFVIKTK